MVKTVCGHPDNYVYSCVNGYVCMYQFVPLSTCVHCVCDSGCNVCCIPLQSKDLKHLCEHGGSRGPQEANSYSQSHTHIPLPLGHKHHVTFDLQYQLSFTKVRTKWCKLSSHCRAIVTCRIFSLHLTQKNSLILFGNWCVHVCEDCFITK